jgi:CBS domain-containing protein
MESLESDGFSHRLGKNIANRPGKIPGARQSPVFFGRNIDRTIRQTLCRIIGRSALMRVYEVMSKHVETVKPDVAASEAKTRMRQRHIHHLVVTKGAELTGILSERDLGGPKLPKILGKTTVEDLMTTPVVTVTSRTPIRKAARLMQGQSIGSLVVTSANGKVAGIVTVADLLEFVARQPGYRSDRDRRAAALRNEEWEK